MFLPESLNTVESEPITYEVVNSSEETLQRVLSCSQTHFSGCLTLAIPGKKKQKQIWNFYFQDGCLVGGINGGNPVRRWYRQVTQYCPQVSQEFSTQLMDSFQLWDYSSLMKRVEQGQLLKSQMIGVVRGNLNEMLFDFIQAHQSRDRASSIQLTYHDFCQSITTTPPVLVQPNPLIQQVVQVWNAWIQAGLGQYSPNLAPVIQDAEALRQQTPPSVYNNLTQLINGDRTFRDLAIKLKQHLIPLTHSIMPYVKQGIIGLDTVSDIAYPTRPTTIVPAQLPQPQPDGPLIAYLEDSRFDSMAMGKILNQAGYRYTSIDDPIQALPMLLEQKPELIFLDLIMPGLNGYEVCAQIRQISTFKHTPVIIVTSSDGIVDRVRAKLMGSSDFLAKPITAEKVLATLQNHLPLPSPLPPPLRLQPPSQRLYPEIRAWPRNRI